MKKIIFLSLFGISTLFATDCGYLKEEVKVLREGYTKLLKENTNLKAQLDSYREKDKLTSKELEKDKNYVDKGDQILDKIKRGTKWTIGKSAEIISDVVDSSKELYEETKEKSDKENTLQSK